MGIVAEQVQVQAIETQTVAGGTRAQRSEADRALAEQLAARLISREEALAARKRRIARVRESIAASDYENALKLSVAVDRMIERHATSERREASR